MKRLLTIIAAAGLLAACNEIPQDAVKSYAGREDTKPYANDVFKGDKAKYENALAERAKFQDEYLRTRDVKR